MTACSLNLLDLICTVINVTAGGTEGNPAVVWMMSIHPAVYAFAKVVIA